MSNTLFKVLAPRGPPAGEGGAWCPWHAVVPLARGLSRSLIGYLIGYLSRHFWVHRCYWQLKVCTSSYVYTPCTVVGVDVLVLPSTSVQIPFFCTLSCAGSVFCPVHCLIIFMFDFLYWLCCYKRPRSEPSSPISQNVDSPTNVTVYLCEVQ